jgi:hypothetical protein
MGIQIWDLAEFTNCYKLPLVRPGTIQSFGSQEQLDITELEVGLGCKKPAMLSQETQKWSGSPSPPMFYLDGDAQSPNR